MINNHFSTMDMADICASRNGSRCKECIFHGNKCDKFMHSHGGIKPGNYDRLKYKIMEWFFRGQVKQ